MVNESPTTHAEQTEVGSYFVANDPPFSVWTPEGASVGLEVLGRRPPLCRSACTYTFRSAESAVISVTSACT